MGTWGAETFNWEALADGKTLLFPQKDEPLGLAMLLTQVDRFLVRFTSKEGTEETATFVVSGLEDHLRKVAKACNWDYSRVRESILKMIKEGK